MAETESFACFLDMLRKGDNPAVNELYVRFANRLVGVARQRLDRRVQGKVGPEDITNSVMRSVVMRLQDGQFDIKDWGGLWGLLLTVTLRKCGRWRDYYTTEARDIGREQGKGARDDGGEVELPGRDEGGPSGGLEMEEALARALRGLDEQQCEMVRLSMEGHEINEISVKMNCSYHRVYRTLNFVGERLEAMRDEGLE